MESPWDDDPQITREVEWSKISSEFTNTGYREGITAGKESALQEGFNDGFVHIGAPLGQDIGVLRGISSALLTFLTSMPPPNTADHDLMVTEIRNITRQLASVSLTDIAPPDLEAEAHAREHLELAEREANDKPTEKRDLEGIGDMLADMSVRSPNAGRTKGGTTLEDVAHLKKQIETLSQALGLGADWK